MGILLPLGIDDFSEIRKGGYYYADKTAFIRELMSRQFKASLVTRPRRFGKTLTMSMLADFLTFPATAAHILMDWKFPAKRNFAGNG